MLFLPFPILNLILYSSLNVGSGAQENASFKAGIGHRIGFLNKVSSAITKKNFSRSATAKKIPTIILNRVKGGG